MSIERDTINVRTPSATPEDMRFDRTLRPTRLDEFIGQDVVKEQLRIAIEAAKLRNEALEHILIYGPPGLGKTTIANIIANELNVPIQTTSGPVLERRGDMAQLLTNVESKGVLFIDEIHRMPPFVEEVLYPAMEDLMFDIVIGEGPQARSIRMNLNPFTLIGATTRAGLLTSPLRDRFGIVQRLEYYDVEAMLRITGRSAEKLALEVSSEAAAEIATRSRGTPRLANRLLRRVRDFAQVEADGAVTIEIARSALDLFQVDKIGLDVIDTKLLTTIIEKFKGGPVGLDTLSAAVGEESNTLEDVVEPFLIQQGFLMRTSRGRVATDLAWEHYGYSDVFSKAKPTSVFPENEE